MPLIAESIRLFLRTVELTDAAASFEIYSDPEVMKYVNDGEPFTQTDDAIENIRRGMSYQKKHGISHWAVIEKSSGEMIGHCGFNLFEGSSDLELVFHFRKKSWGNGYAREAAQMAIKYATDELNAKRMVALTMKENLPSQEVLENVGFASCGEVKIEDVLLLCYEKVN